MKKTLSLRVVTCSIASAIFILSAPLAAQAAGNTHCGATAVQTTGSFIDSGSSAHVYRKKVCNYTYKKKVTFKKCLICNSSWTEYGSQYAEKHSLH